MNHVSKVVRKLGSHASEVDGKVIEGELANVLSSYRQYYINGALQNEWYLDASGNSGRHYEQWRR